jgi:23S rRNA pseudouridine1911/1915/1917 synthase
MAVVARGKPALTHFRVRGSGGGWALVECRLETGRTHQIRVHMRSIGHPLLGDPVYGNGKLPRSLPEPARAFARQALHAARLEFTHPASGERLTFSAPLPRDLADLLAILERNSSAA